MVNASPLGRKPCPPNKLKETYMTRGKKQEFGIEIYSNASIRPKDVKRIISNDSEDWRIYEVFTQTPNNQQSEIIGESKSKD